MAATTNTVRILRHVAHACLESTHGPHEGWCRWSVPKDATWRYGDYADLVWIGWLEKTETHSHVYLRITDSGWDALKELT
jgi:hypothetical protein